MGKRSKGEGRLGQLFRRIMGEAEMPLDVMLDIPRITMIGQMQVQIENHQGILLFTPDAVRIRTRTGVLLIKGRQLKIGSLQKAEVVVEGRIESLDLHPGPHPPDPGSNVPILEQPRVG